MTLQVTTAALVLIGGALGAPARCLVDRAITSRCGDALPWGTAVVNLSGSLALGLLLGVLHQRQDAGWVIALLGTGFCGSFTTFSALMAQTTLLSRDGAWRAAWLNVVGSVLLGLLAGGVGYWLGATVG